MDSCPEFLMRPFLLPQVFLETEQLQVEYVSNSFSKITLINFQLFFAKVNWILWHLPELEILWV